MAVKKITLCLTDIGLHHRTFREAKTLEGAVKSNEDGDNYGRIYTNSAIVPGEKEGELRLRIKLPEELQRQIRDGEVEIEIKMPEGGIPIFLSKDAIEKAEQLRKKERLRLARSGKTWKEV